MTVWFARAKTKKAPARGTLEVAINNQHSYEHNNHNSYFSIFFHILQFRHNVSSKSSSTNLPWSVIHLGFAKCICSDCKINLPLLKSVFLQIVKCICRRLLIYFQPTSSGPLICDNHLAGVVSASKSLETCAFFPQVSVSVSELVFTNLYCICKQLSYSFFLFVLVISPRFTQGWTSTCHGSGKTWKRLSSMQWMQARVTILHFLIVFSSFVSASSEVWGMILLPVVKMHVKIWKTRKYKISSFQTSLF